MRLLLGDTKLLGSMTLRSILLIGTTLFLALHLSVASAADPSGAVIDAVVASVDGKPITLHDVLKRLNPPRKLTFHEAAGDEEVRQVLDLLILEELIEGEAETRKIGVSDAEVDRYLNEVAERNSLSREGFEKALAQEGRKIDEYKRQVKLDILKSKLAANLLKGNVNITDEEVQNYIKEHPELMRTGAKLKLRQIVLNTTSDNSELKKLQLEKIREQAVSGEDFAELAQKHSDSAEAKEGGQLGLVAESDLSQQVFEAIFPLKPGEVSQIVETGAGLHIFKLEERINEGEKDTKNIDEEVKKILQRQKLESKMDSYFATDLYKQHAVDKKL